MMKNNEEFKKICKVCGDEIPIGIRLMRICPKCLIKPVKKN
jgi:hypothetical protein